MGVDIHAWVEVKPGYYDVDPEWVPIIRNVGFLVGRNYDAFGCLFGVLNDANFAPLAAARGLPDDAAADLRQAWWAVKNRFSGTASEPFGESWLAWSELKAVDWDEEAPKADSCPHAYERDEQGNVVYMLKRNDAMTAEWWMLFAMMEALASQYGDDGVRLVAWFYW